MNGRVCASLLVRIVGVVGVVGHDHLGPLVRTVLDLQRALDDILRHDCLRPRLERPNRCDGELHPWPRKLVAAQDEGAAELLDRRAAAVLVGRAVGVEVVVPLVTNDDDD
mgnify:CR=1 FL=1